MSRTEFAFLVFVVTVLLLMGTARSCSSDSTSTVDQFKAGQTPVGGSQWPHP